MPNMKRPAAATAAAKAAKAPRKDPDAHLLKPCLGALAEADVAESVVQMMGTMLRTALVTFKDNRHAVEERVVSMAEELVNEADQSMWKAIQDANFSAKQGEAELDLKQRVVEEAAKTLEQRLVELSAKKRSLAGAAREFQKSKEDVTAAEYAIAAFDVELCAAAEKKATMVDAQETMVKPLVAGEGSEGMAGKLCTLLKTYGFDESVLLALPNAFRKLPSERGSFDEMVLSQVQEECSKRVAALAQMMEESEATKASLQGKRTTADKVREEAQGRQLVAADAYTRSHEISVKAGDDLSTAKHAVKTQTQDNSKRATAIVKAEKRHQAFKDDSLAAFSTMRDRVTPPKEHTVGGVDDAEEADDAMEVSEHSDEQHAPAGDWDSCTGAAHSEGLIGS